MLTVPHRRNRGRIFAQALIECLETRRLLSANVPPVLDNIPDVTMAAAAKTTQLPKTIQIPLTATDTNGDPLTYTVTSSNPNIVPITHTGDPFLKLTVQYAVPEVQTITGASMATGGTFTLSYGGHTTQAISYNSQPSAVQTIIHQELPGLSGVNVGGSPLSTGSLTVMFPPSMGNVSPLTLDTTSLTPSTGFSVAVTTQGNSAATGDIWLMLYKEWAPTTVQNIIGFLNAGFYNNLTFHRIIKGFMAQGGDPKGDGTGGPGFTFKDEFNPNLIFSNRGILAMANSGDDSNGSQFFIADAPFRSGDFTYTIFGQLVRGFTTLDGIMNTPVQANSSSNNEVSQPVSPPVIKSAAIVSNTTDTSITLAAKKAGTAIITVKVNDGHGGISTRTFQVTATADTVNDPAYMTNLTDLTTPVDQPITIPLSGVDLERDPLKFDAAVNGTPAHATVINTGGPSLTIVPDKGYTGVINLTVGVNRWVNRTIPNDPSVVYFNTENITIAVGGKPIHAKPLGFSAIAGAQTQAYVASFTCDEPVNAVTAGSFTATINWGDGTPLVNGDIQKQSGGVYFVTGSHTYVNRGEYPLTVSVVRSALGQTGSVTSVRSFAEVAAAPQAGQTATIINPGGAIVGRLNVPVSQRGSVSSTGNVVSATVNWGDKIVTALPIDENGNFQLLHTYKAIGKFTITITVKDGSGTPAVQKVPATVLAAGPKAVAGGNIDVLGQPHPLALSPSDAGSNVPAGNYWYKVNWGDGSPIQTTTIGTQSATHLYWKAGKFNATVTAVDPWGNAGPVTTYPVSIVNAMIQNNPFNYGTKALFVTGTTGNDNILVGPTATGIGVIVNNKLIGTFPFATDFVYIWGYDGNDSITVDPRIQAVCSLYGGPGNDTLNGGGGYNILVGGDGNDVIKGGVGRSILIGGNGADKLSGQYNDDILVGGRTQWDNYPARLVDLLPEWIQNTGYSTRVANLSGTAGGQNNGVYLEDYTDSSNNLQQTVFDDGVPDTLTGSGGSDWFIANQSTVPADASKKDVLTDKTADEAVLNVTT